MDRNNLYPIFLKTKNLNVLIVGGGFVAEEKLTFLLKSSPDAHVTMVSPMFREGTVKLAKKGCVTLVEDVYKKCIEQTDLADKHVQNFVKEIYDPFTDEQISGKISELLSDESIKAEVKIIFQPVKNLHKACPEHLGDWYFTGDYPTPGGNRVVNQAFINFYEGNDKRAY